MSDHQSAGVGPSVHTSATVSQGPQPPPISRTCTNCATAKIKCMRRDDSHICERCSRLHKECFFRPAKRRNNGTRKDLRIEALEAKFNQLLEAHQSTNPDSVSPPQAAGRPSLSPSSSSSDPGTQAPRIVETTLPRDSMQVAEPLPELHYGPRRDVIDSGLLSLEQAESLLNIYKRTLTPHFPFVILAAHTTAEELRYWKPFLFLAILAASSFEKILLQGEIFKEVRKEICSRMILRGEVSFDLLQGLLVHLAWFMHSQPRQYSQILHLAVSIVADLRLNQPPRAKSQRIAMKFRPEQLAEDMNNNGTSSRASWGQDEQRAIAGCYYLSASTSIFLQKMTIFQHSTYLENCCRDLETRQLQPTDKYMIYIVQLQHIAQKIDTFFAQHGDDLSDPGVTIELSVMTLKSELDIFKERLPFQITESNLLMMQFHTIELYLYQIALTGHRPSSPLVVSSRLHLKMLCAGLVAAKTLLHFYISLPSRTELAFNNTEWIHLGFALLVSSRLSLAVQEDPIYADAQSLRHALDMLYVFNQCIERSHSLRQASSEKDVFFRYEKRIRNVQSWFERHTPRQTNNIVENGVTGLNNGISRESGTSLSDWELSGLSNIPSFEGTYAPNDIYNFTLTDNLPDSMEGVMGDWMSYPMVQF